MSNKSLSIIFVFISIMLTGCEKFQPSPDTVILDLDAIANATGHAATIKQQIEKANKDLNSQLKTISSKLNEQFADEKKKISKKPTVTDKRNMDQLALQANQKMQQAKALASQKSQQYQAALIQQLRQNVQPIAEKIARAQGANIVLTSNNSMIWFNPVIDITDEIIAEMRAQPLTHTNKEEKASTQTGNNKD